MDHVYGIGWHGTTIANAIGSILSTCLALVPSNAISDARTCLNRTAQSKPISTVNGFDFEADRVQLDMTTTVRLVSNPEKFSRFDASSRADTNYEPKQRRNHQPDPRLPARLQMVKEEPKRRRNEREEAQRCPVTNGIRIDKGMAGGRVYGGSNMTVILQNEGIPCSAETLLSSKSFPTFHGSRSIVNFENVNGGHTPNRSFFRPLDQEENGNEDLDECFHQPEKKRRLTSDQVQFLERIFEVENKLEPERKIQLAKDLGLQPRQVAIWFQNRRARWKTKQLERDYDTLNASYNSLKDDYDSLLKEKERLKTEVVSLTDKLLLKEKEKGKSEPSDHDKSSHVQPQKPISSFVSEENIPNVPIVVCKQEDISSAKSDVFDSDSPHYIDGGNSSMLEPANSSHVFEPDQSDLSQDEDDNLSKSLMPPPYSFPNLEDTGYPDLPANSCNFGFPGEDQAFWYWSY
ncbi:hypothetical protein HHK36_007185 [Tetracentron sinense]|uniref:Homeobox-leucine zipper protein n=1 Tax=Tetracentron sinense TaxID=13715 RepID=A0A834ZM21_TETSI|nr:hypothetical protein HHK36_007185 [Tetracentron sinense]